MSEIELNDDGLDAACAAFDQAAYFQTDARISNRCESVEAAIRAYLATSEYPKATYKQTQLQTKLDIAIEALEWFGKLENYMAELKDKGFDYKHTPIHNHGFDKARAALAEITKGD